MEEDSRSRELPKPPSNTEKRQGKRARSPCTGIDQADIEKVECLRVLKTKPLVWLIRQHAIWCIMSDTKITHLLIDTSYLYKFGTGFDHPDFMKLLHCSTIDGTLKIYIPHIVWEERRTQLLDEAYSSRRKLRESFDALNKEISTNIILRGIAPPALSIWSESEIDMWSREAMKRFAIANKIEIVSLAPDHADRAWNRYFNVEPPFNRDEKRENRRKDIPDSWIFEAAIDLSKKHSDLLALVPDGKLSDALKSNGVRVLNHPQLVLDEMDRSTIVEILEDIIRVEDSVSVSMQEKASVTAPQNELELALAPAREQFNDLELKILGFVGYLGTPTKDQLFALLSKSGVPVKTTKNVTERLVIAGILADTGNHYLSRNKQASNLAAASVETEIIQLLEEI